MDSTVCAALAARDYDAYGLHFSYGQRTEARELASARAVAQAVGMRELLELKIDLFRRIGGSALTDSSIDVPDAEGDAGDTSQRTGQDVPVTYVPFRNAHFLSAAVSWAEVLGAATVFIEGDPQHRKPGAEKAAALARQTAGSLSEAVSILLD